MLISLGGPSPRDRGMSSVHNIYKNIKIEWCFLCGYGSKIWTDGVLVERLPGGGTQVQRGAAPASRISRKKGSFF